MNGRNHTNSSRIGADGQAQPPHAAQLIPVDLENRVVREAVRANLVSFPSQVPVFKKQSRPDLQQKLVVLYFVRGWTMHDIAQRYGLARQRMGQILTAWRLRAVQSGYIQAIEPEHPLFQQVRLEQSASAGPVERFTPSLSVEDDEPLSAMPSVAELGGPNLAEELRAIVSILDNQLRLCSRPLSGNIDSCEPLLARAKTICAHLEMQVVPPEEEWGPRVVVSAAKELFQRFQTHAAKRSGRQSKPVFGDAAGSIHPPPSRRASIHVGMQHGQLSHRCEVTFGGSSQTPPTP